MSPTRHPRALILSRPVVIAALATAFGLVLATGLLTALSTRSVSVADARAAQTQRTLGLALDFLTTLSDASVAARTAILTADESALEHYRAAQQHRRTDLARLHAELAPQASAAVFTELQRLVDDRFAASDRALATWRERGTLPALAILDAAESAQPADEIRQLLAALQRQEFNAQAEETALATHRVAMIRILNAGLLLLAFAGVAGLAHWLRRRGRDLETMVTVCAWTRRVLWQGSWISFEEYLIQRFDVRCTHGICHEAAQKMKADAAKVQPHMALPVTGGHSAVPFV